MSAKETSPPDHRFDLQAISELDLRASINAIEVDSSDDDQPSPLIELSGLAKQPATCMRWQSLVRVHALGDLGDFAFACNGGPDIHLEGSVGDGACEGMSAGVIRITGSAGCGLGAAMTGGTVAVYGSAGSRVGAAMRGGSIFVRGSVGEDTGAGALGGTIVVGGDAGANIGDGLNNVTVFIRGKAESLVPGVTEAPLRKREQVRLGLLLMSASIRGSAADFRRIIPIAKLKAEQAGQGEVQPNWR